MTAILLALISYVGWAVGDVFGTIVTRKIGYYTSTFWLYILSFPLLFAILPFELADLGRIDGPILILIAFLGLIYTIAQFSFYKALEVGNASLVGTIAGSFPAVTVLLATVFLGESLGFYQWFAIVIILAGIITSSVKFNELNLKDIFKESGVKHAFIAMLFWGLYFALVKIPIRQVGWFWPNMIGLTIFTPIVFVFLKFFKRVALPAPDKITLRNILLSAVLFGGATLAYNLGARSGLTSIIAPISGSYPSLFVILSYFIFKEKLTKQQMAGIAITLAGIVWLSYLSA